MRDTLNFFSVVGHVVYKCALHGKQALTFLSSVTHTLMARKNARDKNAEWKKNILIEWYRHRDHPFRDSDIEYTDDNYEKFHACFIDTHAIVYSSAKTPKVYTADLVADLKNDAYLVSLKAWLDADNASNMTVVPPKKRPLPALPVARPSGPAAGLGGYGPSVGYGGPPPPPGFQSGGISVDRFHEEELKVARLRAQNDSFGAELHNARDKIFEMEHALKLAAQREAQRNAADREAQIGRAHV